MARVINFEGRRITVPDDATDAEIRGILSSQPAQSSASETIAPATPQPASPVQPPADSGWLDAIMGVADQGMRGVYEGMTNVVGAPHALAKLSNRLTGGAARYLGAPDPVVTAAGMLNPFEYLTPSAEQLQAVPDAMNNATADALGVERPRTEPRNIFERVANRSMEEVGAMLLPAAGASSRAASLVAQYGDDAARAAREGGRLSRMFVEPAVVNAPRYIGNEAKIALGAGLGAAGANEVVDPNTTAGQIADFIGSIGGAGATALGSKVAGGIGEMYRALTGDPNYADDVVRNEVADRIISAANVPTKPGDVPDAMDLVRTIENGPRIGNQLPGVQESLADRTRNSGIASLEYARQSGPNAGLFNARRVKNAEAIDDVISAIEPQGSAAALRGELDAERGRRLADADVFATNAQEAAAKAVDPVTPKTTPTARGNAVRGALEEARDAARSATDDAYAQLDINGRAIAAEDISGPIEDTIGGLTQAERSLLPEGLLDRVARLEGEVTLKEATDLRSELSRLSRAALADSKAERGGRNAARVIDKMRDTVDQVIDANITPDERDFLKQARATKFDEAERFTRQGDPVAGALARYEGGQPRVSDERVAGTFTDPQAMDRLFAQADTPDVRNAIRDEMLARADTGRADRIEQFITQNSEQMKRFPGLEDDLRKAATARAEEAAATGARDELQRTLGTTEKRGTSTVGKYLSYSDATSDKAIREVLAARDPAQAADELLTFVNDSPQAVEGARKALWDAMAKQTRRAGETTATAPGNQPWMPAALKRWLDNPANRAVAERFYKDNPEHIENLRAIADTLQGLDVRNTAKVPNASGTAQSLLPSAETLGSLALARQRGQIGIPFILTRLGAVMGRRAVRNARGDAVERILDTVLLDPDAAALLLRENNPANRAALNRWAKLWFGNDASKIMQMLGEDDEDETEQAVKRPLELTVTKPANRDELMDAVNGN